MIQKLIIPPDRNTYSVLDGTEVLSVQLDGGSSKYRQDILNSNCKITVQWTLNPIQYNYIRSFYKYTINNGALPFLMDLFIDNPFELTEHECYIIPGTFGLKNQSGESFTVGCSIEAKPIKDQNLIDSGLLYGLFEEEYESYTSTFDNLMNVKIPGDF